MRRVAVIAGDHTDWSDSVVAGLAERHDVLLLLRHSSRWHLGRRALGETPSASLAAAVSVLATAEVALPLTANAQVASLCELVGLPFAGSGLGPIALSRDWWATRLAAQDAGVAIAAGVRVSRSLARGLDYLEPVEVRPVIRGPLPGRTRVESAAELPLALERAFTYAEHVVVEEALDGERVTVAILRRADGAALVCPPYRERVSAGIAAPPWTGEIPVRAGRRHGGGERTEAQPRPEQGGQAAATGASIAVAQLDPIDRRRVDHDALSVLTALGAAGATTVTFLLTASGPVLDDVDLAPALGPRDAVPSLFAGAGTSYPALLDALVDAAR